MPLSRNAITVLEKRYLRKDATGRIIESPEALFNRVATALAEPDRLYGATDAEVKFTADQFFAIIENLEFLPNSPTLANAGLGMNLSACFVLPVPDDLAGIFEAVKQAALVHQFGGGTGFAFSRLRPKNDIVRSTMGVSSGPVSFMQAFDAATESIKQGGMRRGANMGILRVDHPDILAFIDHKEDLTRLTNFNISVAVTNAFMAAVEAGTTYDLINPRTGQATGSLNARTVFERIAQRAHSTGEPGVVFIDRMNDDCPVPWMGLYEATNPCGEQPLIPYESCNLGSINLERFVVYDYDEPPTRTARIDWERLAEVVAVATHLLDNVIDANTYPIPQLETVAKATRKIGLGVMGFGRLCYHLGIPYGSEASLRLAEQVMSFIDYHSKLTSVGLAIARGPFPARSGHEAESNALYRRWCLERDSQASRHPDCDYIRLAELIDAHGVRNSTTTTIAPTGTLSIIADTSGGCEPVFALAFKRFQADTHMVEADPVFHQALEAVRLSREERAMVLTGTEENHGSLAAFLARIEDTGMFGSHDAAKLGELARVFVTAHDVSVDQHVRIQAAFQKFNDSATSKTINAPHDATVDDVLAAYRLAWETGCKGITYYRDGSRDNQPLSTASKQESTVNPQAPPSAEQAMCLLRRDTADMRTRPEDLYGFTRKVQTADGRLYVAVNYDAEGPREVVASVGRSGGTLSGLTEAIGRLISLALQYRVPVDEIAKQLIGIRGPSSSGFGPNMVLSLPDAIGKVLKSAPRHLGGVVPTAPVLAPALAKGDEVAHAVEQLGHSPECPECLARLTFEEGCRKCHACGYAACG